MPKQDRLASYQVQVRGDEAWLENTKTKEKFFVDDKSKPAHMRFLKHMWRKMNSAIRLSRVNI